VTAVNFQRPSARFWLAIALGGLAFVAQVARFQYALVVSESVHAALIVVLVLAWLTALIWTFRSSWRWGLGAALSTPFALLFFVWLAIIFFACAFGGACI